MLLEIEASEKRGNPVKLTVYGKDVLDVTKFRHPGPKELIEDNIGKDMQHEFDD